jgi:uncharacterized protein
VPGLKRLIRFAASHPWLVLASLTLLTALAAGQLSRLEVSISAEGMLEKGTPAWDDFVATEATFGSEDVAIIVFRDPDLFAVEKLSAAREVVRALGQLPYVSSTSSLFDIPNLKNLDGFISAEPYLEEFPETAAAVAQVKAEAIRNPLALGNLISADGQTLAVNVFLDRKVGDAGFDQAATRAIEDLIVPLRMQIADVYQVSVSAMRSDLTGKILGDQRVILPLAVLILLLILAFSLRRATAALMPLATAG